MTEKINPAMIRERLLALWNGDLPLFQTFWIYYFLGVFVLKTLGVALSGIGVVFSVLAVLWAGFMVKPIIAAADRYTGEKTWALAAKIAAVLIAVAAIGDLVG